MKNENVKIGGEYGAKVTGTITLVRILSENPHGGWNALNLRTNRGVRIKSAKRLRPLIESKAAIPDVEDDAPKFDPSRCATEGCRGEPEMVHLERPLCGECWAEHCRKERANEEAGGVCVPQNSEPEALKENDMATKTKTKTKSPSKKAAPQRKAKSPDAGAEKKVSALDAAETVLKRAKKPMRSQELITAMEDATLHAAMMREISVKKNESRFAKVGRGEFALAK